MLGFPATGAVLGLPSLDAADLPRAVPFFAASFLLACYVYGLNSWGGYEQDLSDAHRLSNPLLAGEIDRGEVLRSALVCLGLSLALFAAISRPALLLALLLAFLWTLYCHPRSLAKGIPLAAAFIHLAGGMAQFLIGYAIFQPIGWHGIAWAVFFALVFLAGHFTHEIKDLDADRAAGLDTVAVRLGARRAFALSGAVFLAAYLFLVFFFPAWLVGVLFHAVIFFRYWGGTLDRAAILGYRREYRGLFGLLAVLLVGLKLKVLLLGPG